MQGHRLPQEKQDEFLKTMTSQIDKLDFLLQSLIKMSRLETGTFALHMEKGSLYSTLAEALNGIWARAEQKKIRISLECGRNIVLCHDAKWTAEAAGEEGLGLGLYLARDIIMRQKGYITVQSEEGEGTTFSVFLPD